MSAITWTFTDCLIDALHGKPDADIDGNGSVSVFDVGEYVHTETRFREEQYSVPYRSPSFPEGLVLRDVVGDTTLLQGTDVPKYIEFRTPAGWKPARVLAREAGGYWLEATRLKGERFHVRDSDVRLPPVLDLRVGDAVRVDWHGQWFEASVVEVGRDFVLVRYDGFGSEWDEWVSTSRLADL